MFMISQMFPLVKILFCMICFIIFIIKLLLLQMGPFISLFPNTSCVMKILIIICQLMFNALLNYRKFLLSLHFLFLLFLFIENKVFHIIYPNYGFSSPSTPLSSSPLTLSSGSTPFVSLITKSTGFYGIITKHNIILYDKTKTNMRI